MFTPQFKQVVKVFAWVVAILILVTNQVVMWFQLNAIQKGVEAKPKIVEVPVVASATPTATPTAAFKVTPKKVATPTPVVTQEPVVEETPVQ